MATLQARLGVVDQISEAAAARAAELAEARAQMTQKLGHIASLRAELDDERARSHSLAQVFCLCSTCIKQLPFPLPCARSCTTSAPAASCSRRCCGCSYVEFV